MIFRPLIVIKRIPNIDFMGLHKLGFALSIVLTLASVVLFLTVGLNYGIDFSGGVLVEARTQGPADLGAMRTKLDGLGLGQVSLQSSALLPARNIRASCGSGPPPRSRR